MKNIKQLFFLFLLFATITPCYAKKMGAYLMVYHKDCDHSLHMAISYDGYTWTALRDDKPVFSGDTIAVQHGIRDPHIFRGPDGAFYLAMTDLHLFSRDTFRDDSRYSKLSEYRATEWERDGKKYGWGNNRGLVVMKSRDLLHWTRTNLDFSALDGKPMPLFEAPERRYNVIDSDIIHVGDLYHLFFVSHEHGATPVHATSRRILGPYEIDTLYNDNEKGGHEAPNCWKRIGEEKYILMFDNYSMRPHNFGFVETTDFRTFTPIGHFDEEGSPMCRTNFAEQKHGAVIQITKKEAKRMEKYWNKQ